MWLYSITNLYFIVIVQYSFCCICTSSNYTVSPTRLKGETGDIKEKRQLHLEEYGSLEFLIDPEPTDIDAKRNSSTTFIMINVTSTEINNIDKEVNITSIEINDMTIPTKSVNSDLRMTTPINNIYPFNVDNFIIMKYIHNTSSDSGNISFDSVVTNINTVVSEKTTAKQDVSKEDQIGDCLKYKKTKRYDVNKLADVWKITFYTIPTTLKCFRLHIKKVRLEDQKRYEATYGDFDDRIKWKNCVLEITSSENKRFDLQRRHFLQKNDLQNGVLENIIIDQERDGNTTSVLHEESPDQWLVVKNLLLMRDCITGDVVVFSRVPSEPLMSDIEDALVEFGESGPINGTRACEGFVKAWVKVG